MNTYKEKIIQALHEGSNDLSYERKEDGQLAALDKAGFMVIPKNPDADMLEIGRRAIEDELIDWRDSRLSTPLRGNGLVVRERDGTPSNTIRFGPEHALRIGIQAIAEAMHEKDASCDFDNEDGHCFVCQTELFAYLDNDPNGDPNGKCARCVAEEEHDYDNDPYALFDRKGERVDC